MVDLDRIEALASTAGLPIEDFLQRGILGVGDPGPRLPIRLDQVGQVLAAVDVGLLDADLDSAFDPRSRAVGISVA
jgi:hypothetical protein